jgi:small-conductance mechanosensitive channel/CRP-like cAMP-binding protein
MPRLSREVTMSDEAWLTYLAWAAVVVAGYPVAAIILSEATRRIASPDSLLLRPFKVAQNFLLPAAVIWILVHKLMSFPADSMTLKIVDTTTGIVVLYAVLQFGQALLMAFRSRLDGGLSAPQLFYELGALVIAVVGGAMIISSVWDIELTTLFGALGVGSVVLGLALQSVIGGLANGLIVLSGRHFAIGDWLEIGGTYAKIVQVDWRSVTLMGSGGERIVVPSSKLATDTLRLRPDREPLSVRTALNVSAAHPPGKVMQVLREAADNAARFVGGENAASGIAEYVGQDIRYTTGFLVTDPAKAGPALDALLIRVWYVCQRHGIVLPGIAAADAAPERARILAASGALRGSPESLAELAEASRLERYAKGEELLRRGERPDRFIVVVAGQLSLTLEDGLEPAVIDQLAPGQLFAIREIFRGITSPLDVVAEEDSQVLSIPRSAMLKLLDANRSLAIDLEATMETRAELLGRFTAKDKAADLRALHRVA